MHGIVGGITGVKKTGGNRRIPSLITGGSRSSQTGKPRCRQGKDGHNHSAYSPLSTVQVKATACCGTEHRTKSRAEFALSPSVTDSMSWGRRALSAPSTASRRNSPRHPPRQFALALNAHTYSKSTCLPSVVHFTHADLAGVPHHN